MSCMTDYTKFGNLKVKVKNSLSFYLAVVRNCNLKILQIYSVLSKNCDIFLLAAIAGFSTWLKTSVSRKSQTEQHIFQPTVVLIST